MTGEVQARFIAGVSSDNSLRDVKFLRDNLNPQVKQRHRFVLRAVLCLATRSSRVQDCAVDTNYVVHGIGGCLMLTPTMV